MADYWKSNERKYCDFCNCWISDNKASIAFHESGKRHKLAVAKRITDISKKSENAEREKKKMDAEIRKMEDAAMRAYTQDIHSRRDMTAASVGTVMNIGPAVISAGGTTAGTSASATQRAKQIDPLRLQGDSDDEGEHGRVLVKKVDPETVPNASLWVEGKTDEGYSYYWNVKTNESVWQAPKEGFLTYDEYNRINEIAIKQQEMQQAVEAKKFRENANEEVARYNREKLKMLRPPPQEPAKAKEQHDELIKSYKTEAEAATPEIGSWQVVEHKPPPAPVDLELPQSNYYYAAPVVTEAAYEPPTKRFKEKTIESLDPATTAGTAITFKKRKFTNKGNARQRLNDD